MSANQRIALAVGTFLLLEFLPCWAGRTTLDRLRPAKPLAR